MIMRELQLLRHVAWIALCASWTFTASAQPLPVCEDDAGSATCDDDAGVVPPEPADAGTPLDAGVSGDAGTGRPPIGSGRACSCESELDDDGRIHVCTESDDSLVCRSFDCDLGTRLDRPCPTAPTRLCCEMPARKLQSYLYEDCTHPNCESGFREQCREFGGRVYRGACEQPAMPGTGGDRGDEDDGGSICSATYPGAGAKTGAAWLALLGAAGLFMRRRAVRRA